ncbi:MAG TPA: hypothetical protein VEC16_04420 [Alphaproteobacteria bacterium]|nr:hypothetical protein [Alphaproteobacteria bacterium]
MGSGWSDSRITYPYDRILITPVLYVVDTQHCTTNELWDLLYNNRGQSIKSSYEMMSYLVGFKPAAVAVPDRINKKMYYTPSINNFVISSDPGKPLLSYKCQDALTVAKQMLQDIESALAEKILEDPEISLDKLLK